MTIIDILHDCRLFSQLDADGFRRLATIGRLTTYRKGQVIFREGQPCPGVFIVGQGMVRVFKTASNGREHVLHIVGPGDCFAEAAAIGNFALPATAEALKKTACVLLPLDQFRRTLAENNEISLGMMAGLALWARHLVTMIEDIALRDAAGRLARYLLDLAAESGGRTESGGRGSRRAEDFESAGSAGASPSRKNRDSSGVIKLPGLKRHVASQLNLTSETFSRTLRRLVEAGLIAEVDAAGVKIVHPKQLRQVAEGLFPRL
jgi:CRP/FNR family transcriptional regulator, dissimilatory nitrate respiration regulator